MKHKKEWLVNDLLAYAALILYLLAVIGEFILSIPNGVLLWAYIIVTTAPHRMTIILY